MKKTFSLSFMLMAILFTVCLIVSNVLAFKRIDVFGFPATAGLLIFPLSYVLNDCIVEVWGFRKARLIIWSGFAMNFFVIALFQLAIIIPSHYSWTEQDAFAAVLGQAPRIAVASLFAFLTGSFLNAYVMSRMKVASQGKNFSYRAIMSTIAGELVDSAVFCIIAFVGLMPLEVLGLMILTQATLKTAYEIIILPVTVQVVKYVKKTEGTDVFDENISYNVLKIGDVE